MFIAKLIRLDFWFSRANRAPAVPYTGPLYVSCLSLTVIVHKLVFALNLMFVMGSLRAHVDCTGA